jgi:hypothetical protein
MHLFARKRPRKLTYVNRIRKVKCDEAFPACQRCIKTGRICDGYGIWGGGGSHSSHCKTILVSEDVSIVPRAPTSSIDDKGYLEWFKCRTAIKLPGTFRSSSPWSTLLMQASFSEPAVLHAVLALSSVHKRNTVNIDGWRQMIDAPDKQEQFALRNYIKSIKAVSHLRPHCLVNDKASLRVALITCIMFVCLEFLRGHFQTAQAHLKHGITILRELQLYSDRNRGTSDIGSSRGSTDTWIAEGFSRFNLQMELFQYGYEHSGTYLQSRWHENPSAVFQSLFDAWQELVSVFSAVFYLSRQARQRSLCECTLEQTLELLECQQRMHSYLTQWLVTWDAFKRSRGQLSDDYRKAYQVVHAYHTMATIMLSTCLNPHDETIFDTQTNQFTYLVAQLVELHDIRTIKVLPGNLMDMTHSVSDLGWIAPLYFVATKCRVHRVRLQAVRLLESTSHREGIWDSKITARVAKKVMEIEEGDYYKSPDIDDNFPLGATPTPVELELPILPKLYRVCELEVVLSGAPLDRVLLFCKRKVDDVDRRVLLSEYDVHTQRWSD